MEEEEEEGSQEEVHIEAEKDEACSSEVLEVSKVNLSSSMLFEKCDELCRKDVAVTLAMQLVAEVVTKSLEDSEQDAREKEVAVDRAQRLISKMSRMNIDQEEELEEEEEVESTGIQETESAGDKAKQLLSAVSKRDQTADESDSDEGRELSPSSRGVRHRRRGQCSWLWEIPERPLAPLWHNMESVVDELFRCRLVELFKDCPKIMYDLELRNQPEHHPGRHAGLRVDHLQVAERSPHSGTVKSAPTTRSVHQHSGDSCSGGVHGFRQQPFHRVGLSLPVWLLRHWISAHFGELFRLHYRSWRVIHALLSSLTSYSGCAVLFGELFRFLLGWEYYPVKDRGTVSLYMTFYWSCGQMLLVVTASVVYAIFDNWRWLVFVTSLPIFALFFVVEARRSAFPCSRLRGRSNLLPRWKIVDTRGFRLGGSARILRCNFFQAFLKRLASRIFCFTSGFCLLLVPGERPLLPGEPPVRPGRKAAGADAGHEQGAPAQGQTQGGRGRHQGQGQLPGAAPEKVPPRHLPPPLVPGARRGDRKEIPQRTFIVPNPQPFKMDFNFETHREESVEGRSRKRVVE
ncbi:hypothetical protein CEXT_94281 [Caerostris extrusa]|uniref:XK-related protein n=1 Tax=Caerostris extrusa TaxID=172846 RepID=A0AAV4VKW8_CAEEX|nr:hypothetical protein CEXT_94281 [Caerostris extrusa]